MPRSAPLSSLRWQPLPTANCHCLELVSSFIQLMLWWAGDQLGISVLLLFVHLMTKSYHQFATLPLPLPPLSSRPGGTRAPLFAWPLPTARPHFECKHIIHLNCLWFFLLFVSLLVFIVAAVFAAVAVIAGQAMRRQIRLMFEAYPLPALPLDKEKSVFKKNLLFFFSGLKL